MEVLFDLLGKKIHTKLLKHLYQILRHTGPLKEILEDTTDICSKNVK